MVGDASVRYAAESLARLELFSGLKEEQLDQLVSLGEITTLPARTTLFREGDQGDKLYLILEGDLEVSNAVEEHVYPLTRGDIFGEIALLDGLPRTATVESASDCRLFGLSRSQFEAFLALDPALALNVMRVANRKIRAALEREKSLNLSLRRANDELERLNQGLEGLVQQKTRQLTLANQNLKELLERDPLTGTHNRRKFDALMEQRAEEGRDFALVMLDIDHFKQINDTHGHEAGDRVLMTLANLAEERLAEGRYLIRFGGEEFVFLLEGVDPAGASGFAEAVRSAIESFHFPLRDCLPGDVTASFGVAHFPSHCRAVEEVLKTADEALYRAKNEGRNRVVVAGSG